MEKKIAALYIRVSTDEQTELSPDAQKRLLVEYAKKNNYRVVPEYIFIENGISGRKADNRPEFKKMIALAKSKEHPFDTILVWKYSRFARNQEESIVYKSLLRKNNVDVLSISEPLPDGMIGSLVERIFEWMDEYYSINLSVEVTRGMTENALRGHYQGSIPIGYTYEPGKDAVPMIQVEQAAIVQRIFQSYANGSTLTQIAIDLNDEGLRTQRGKIFENRTVKYILQNPFYIGKVRWNYFNRKTNMKKSDDEVIIADGKHEPIISQELWDTVQKRLNARTIPYKKRDVAVCKHWLSGIVHCSSCGSVLGHNTGSKHDGFQCCKYSKGMCKESHYIGSKRLENAIKQGVAYSIDNLKNYDINVIKRESGNEKLSLLQKSLQKLDTKEKRIKTAYLNGIDTLEEYKENKQLIQEERNKILDEINKMEQPRELDREECERILKGRLEELLIILNDEEADYIKKGNAMREVISQVIFDKKNNSFQYVFQVLS